MIYAIIEECRTKEELDSIRASVLAAIASCEDVEEMKHIQDAFRKQKNRIRIGRYRQEERSSE